MSDEKPASDLLARVVAGEQRAAARLMRLVDDRVPGYLDKLKALHPYTGKAYVLGVTGTPGAGKSTLVDCLIEHHRTRDRRVGVLAVDPSSPFSGGAILGDRIRMQRHFLDDKVFIRSLATRGHLGGLSRSAADVLRVLDAFGCDVILVETVGVGQDELDVARLAHTTIVVTAPGGGDDIQAIKAGILEIADVFAVNKADRDGAENTVRDLEGMLALSEATRPHSPKGHSAAHARASADGALTADGRWRPPIVRTVAVRREGVTDLMAACEAHQTYLSTTEAGRARLRQRREAEFVEIFGDLLRGAAEAKLGSALATARGEVADGQRDPYSVAEELLAKVVC